MTHSYGGMFKLIGIHLGVKNRTNQFGIKERTNYALRINEKVKVQLENWLKQLNEHPEECFNSDETVWYQHKVSEPIKSVDKEEKLSTKSTKCSESLPIKPKKEEKKSSKQTKQDDFNNA